MKTISFEIDKEIYSKAVVLRACHTFSSNYSITFNSGSAGKWKITIEEKVENDPEKDKIQEKFNNILINEAFREELSEKTKNTREIIIARALLGADTEIEEETTLEPEEDFSFIDDEIKPQEA